MIFNSVSYLIFFPVIVLLYFIIPYKFRNLWLLLASYFFYMNWNAKYAILLAASTIITFCCSLLVEHFRIRQKMALAKSALALSCILNIGILIYFKYWNFFIDNTNKIMHFLHHDVSISKFDIVLPVGISFYIFQALSYTIDVYRGDVKTTRNLLRYALFVSFFPQLVAGPIERTKNLLAQFEVKQKFDVDRIRSGLLMMLWGLFMKIVIADNLSGIVTKIYDNYLEYTGVEIIFATVLFAFQIYCDFGGYSCLAIGSAKVLGFRLMDNFKSPYLAVSMKEFWDRWHISLTSWFRDYLYIPLGGNRKGKTRKYINIMIIFLVSGLWHGAEWSFVIWGGLNGLLLVIEDLTRPLRSSFYHKMKIDTTSFSFRFLATIGTFAMVDFTWLFFRAENISLVIALLRQTTANFGFHRLFGYAIANTGLDIQTILVIAFSLFLLFSVDFYKAKQVDINALVLTQNALFRYLVYGGLLLFIMFFGVYGYEYTQNAFIYFQF